MGNVNKMLWEYRVGSKSFACDGDWVRRGAPGTTSQAEEHLHRNYQNGQVFNRLKKENTEHYGKKIFHEKGSEGEKVSKLCSDLSWLQ